MATGWQELYEQWRNAPVDAPPEALSDLWSEFANLMARSGRSVRLSRFLEQQPNSNVVMGLIAALLAPIDWPIDWEARRPELVRALTELTRQTRPGDPFGDDGPEPATFFAQVELGRQKAAFLLGHRVLAVATDLLGTPCRRDQIATVAGLCNVATGALRDAYAHALAQHGERAMREPLLGAHLRYRVAVLRYDDAALAMNDAIGAVYFHPFGAAGPTPPALAES